MQMQADRIKHGRSGREHSGSGILLTPVLMEEDPEYARNFETYVQDKGILKLLKAKQSACLHA